jgi:tape measure domain-containing protein
VAKNRVQIIISAVDKGVHKVFGGVMGGLQKLSAAAKGVFSPGGLIAGAAGGLGLGFLTKSFIDTASGFEQMDLQLGRVFGSAKKGREAFSWLMDQRLPFEVDTLNRAMVKLQVMGLNPMGGNLQTLTDAVAAFGGDSQVLDRATVAITQMAGKGVISMEELRQQLSESIPTAAQDMAKGLGMSMGQMVELISDGDLEATKGLEAMFKVWREKFSGATKDISGTWEGLVRTLGNHWKMFQKAVMDSGPFQGLKAVLKGFVDQIDKLKTSGKFDTIAADFGARIVSGLKKGLEFLPTFGLALVKGAEMLMLAFSGWKQIKAAADILLIKLKIWGLEFIEGLRDVMLVMMETVDKIPGVDTSQAQVRALSDSASTQWRIGDASRELEAAEVVLGRIIIKQDEMSEKFQNVGRAVDQSLTKIASDAWLKLDEAQKIAAAGAGNAAEVTKEAGGEMKTSLGEVEQAADKVEKALKKAGKAAKKTGEDVKEGADEKKSEIETLLRRWEELAKQQEAYAAKHSYISFSPDGETTGGRTDFRGSNYGGKDQFDAGDLKKQAEALNTVADSQKAVAENAERHATAVKLSADYMAAWQKAVAGGDDVVMAKVKSYEALANSLAKVASMSELAAANLLKLGESQARGSGNNTSDPLASIESALTLAERTGR